MPPSTGSSIVVSLMLPAVTTIDSGRPLPSQARCVLVVQLPQDHPNA